MEYANIMVAIGGDGAHQVPKYNVTPAEVMVLRFLHGDQSITDVDVQGPLNKDADEELQRPRTDRQEVERLRGLYSRQDGDVVISPAVTALFGNGIGRNIPSTFAELELDDSQFAVKERKTSAKKDALDHDGDGQKGGAKNDADGYQGMTVNDLRAKAEKDGVDLTGLTKKDDIIAALELNDGSKNGSGSVFE